MKLDDVILRGTRASQPAATAVDGGTLYCVTDEGNIVERSTGAAWQAYSPTSDGIPETLLDAKGDMIAASAADTAAKVTVGANGTVLKANSGASAGVNWALDQIDSGTSNPGSPTNGDLFWRTDLDLIIFYDGTRWLTTNQYCIQLPRWSAFAATGLSVTTANVFLGDCIFTPTYDFWIERFQVSAFVLTTNNGTNFWTFTLLSDDATAGSETTITSVNTAASSANAYLSLSVTVGALLGTTQRVYTSSATKTLSPGNVNYIGATVLGRLVIT